MRERNSASLGRFSEELAAMVRATAPILAAVRLGSSNVSGFIWSSGVLVASRRASGTRDIVMPGRLSIPAQPLLMSEDIGISAFRVSVPGHEPAPPLPNENAPSVGSLVLTLGAAPDASPMARLMMVSRAGADGVRLDRSLAASAEGGPVLDPQGRLLGMALAASDGGCALLEVAAIARALATPSPGWIGVAFQPTLVPVSLRAEAGQDSARRVVRVARGGPAEGAGLIVGDIVLTLDGIGLTGTGTLRGFLAAARPGREITARLLRGGRIETRRLVVAVDPNPP